MLSHGHEEEPKSNSAHHFKLHILKNGWKSFIENRYCKLYLRNTAVIKKTWLYWSLWTHLLFDLIAYRGRRVMAITDNAKIVLNCWFKTIQYMPTWTNTSCRTGCIEKLSDNSLGSHLCYWTSHEIFHPTRSWGLYLSCQRHFRHLYLFFFSSYSIMTRPLCTKHRSIKKEMEELQWYTQPLTTLNTSWMNCYIDCEPGLLIHHHRLTWQMLCWLKKRYKFPWIHCKIL